MARRKHGHEKWALFNPEGRGYDYKSALGYGKSKLYDKKTKHWSSRIPSMRDDKPYYAGGLVLKGRKHPTWDKFVAGEKEAGYEIYKGRDGRYYTRRVHVSDAPKPRRVKGHTISPV